MFFLQFRKLHRQAHGLVSIMIKYPLGLRRKIKGAARKTIIIPSSIAGGTRREHLCICSALCVHQKNPNEIETVANVCSLMGIKLFLSYMITSFSILLEMDGFPFQHHSIVYITLEAALHFSEIIRITFEALAARNACIITNFICC